MNRPLQIGLVATGCAALVGLILGCDSSGSSGPRPGGAGGGGNGGQNAGNDAASAACLGAGLSCTAGQACCSGICDVSTGTCGSSVALCLDPGLPCQYATDCCNLSCVGGFCAPNVSICVADNAACTSSAACCSGTCSAGLCSPLNTACKTAGNPCADSTECCSHLCTNGTCTLSVSYCIQTGDVCYRGSDCCSGLCNTSGAGAAGVCAELATTGAGNCAKDGTGVRRLHQLLQRPVPTLRPHRREDLPARQRLPRDNNLCVKDKDCCGGDPTSGLPGAGNVTCQLADNVLPALGVCRNPLSCNPQGGICGLKNSTGPACTNARGRLLRLPAAKCSAASPIRSAFRAATVARPPTVPPATPARSLAASTATTSAPSPQSAAAACPACPARTDSFAV